MKTLQRILNFINPPPVPTYGAGIFHQKTWLTRQVEDAMFRQAKNQIHQLR
jgi:hypothetical protein